MSGGHGHGADHGGNKTVALAISVLALLLAVAEILGQSAQTKTLQSNIEASNLWAFFQAKTIRRTITEVAADEMETALAGIKDANVEKAMKDRIAKFRATAQRYRTEPETGEGSTELAKRAQEAEKARDKHGRKHYRFELASGAFQIGIVLASAAIITGLTLMLWAAGGLAAVGIVFLASGLSI
jgi:hypothetical protein